MTLSENPNLDPVTRAQLRDIASEEDIKILFNKLEGLLNEITRLRIDLDITTRRVLVLEEVRLKQRELNGTFVQKDKVEVKEIKKPRFKFW